MMKHLILAFSLLACPLAKGEILPRVAPEEVGLNSTQLIQADRAINEAIQKKQIPGAVLAVVRQGKMAYLKAYGKRSLIPSVEAMTTNTIFDMASCSKPMGTAMAVMKLIEQGRLRLTDPVSLYIPGFKNWEKEDKSDATTIRIHHLLTHSSGLPAYVSPIDLKKKYDKADRDVVIDYICNCRRGFEPATNFRYSCLNFITLQRIVENITGETLRDFTRKEIFSPLGMDHTDYLPCEEDAKGIWRNTALPCWTSAEERKKLERHSARCRIPERRCTHGETKNNRTSTAWTSTRPPCTHCQPRNQRQCRCFYHSRRHRPAVRHASKRRRMERQAHLVATHRKTDAQHSEHRT